MRGVRRAEYGPDASVVVNLGEADFDYHGTVLPQYRLLIESPTFLAFCAKRFNGVDYREPSLFTIQSLDNLPIPDSHHLRLSHAFGSDHLRLPTTRTQGVRARHLLDRSRRPG